MHDIDIDLLEDRLALANRYNLAAGILDVAANNQQAAFVRGEMTRDEMVSYVRYCQFRIAQSLRFKL
jgi:hypothetical protein